MLRVVGQDFITSPVVFYLYSEDKVNKALDNQHIDVEINGMAINILS